MVLCVFVVLLLLFEMTWKVYAFEKTLVSVVSCVLCGFSCVYWNTQ